MTREKLNDLLDKRAKLEADINSKIESDADAVLCGGDPVHSGAVNRLVQDRNILDLAIEKARSLL
ncbi:hypothetical protein ASG68_08360 [Rhizobium sp. Leaf453]|nr:hypothetical protein ASG68_08360 [Rhizobium sp. Leaf453]